MEAQGEGEKQGNSEWWSSPNTYVSQLISLSYMDTVHGTQKQLRWQRQGSRLTDHHNKLKIMTKFEIL